MKFPENAEEVKNEILISSDKSCEIGDLRIRQLIHILPKLDPEIVIEGVIKIFDTDYRVETFFLDQEFAGKVLETVNPKSKKPLEEILQRTLTNWDKSIEQLPFWLRDNYGLEKIKEVFKNIEVNEVEKDKLNTMRYWLKL